MKIRLMGSPDLVRAWSAKLERAYGLKASIYPSRRGGNEIRAYFDLDDRQAASIVGQEATATDRDRVGQRIGVAKGKFEVPDSER